MSSFITVAVTGMAFARIALGLAPFLAAGPVARLVGFPASHDTATARLMGRFFGVRDIGLGVLALWGLSNPAVLPFVLLFNAFMDAGDLVATGIPLVKRQGIDRGAALSAAMAAIGGIGWVAMYLVAR
jgi:hypothetical protein